MIRNLLLLWHERPGVCSTKCRPQSAELTILSHVNCFIQGQTIGFQPDQFYQITTQAKQQKLFYWALDITELILFPYYQYSTKISK